MITCPKCNSGTWETLHRSPIDPAEDSFLCSDCGHKFRRYDPPVDQFNRGMADRLRGMPCDSANGRYLDGYYSA